MDWRDYQNGIYAFDAGYVRPILAAIHVIVDSGRVAFVDTGSNDALPHALSALARLGLGPEAVDYVMLTHIHLDHAGGAGRFMEAFPKARLLVHPRGVRHMAAPEKLVAGVTAVYGADYVARVYGEIQPIPAERIVAATDGLNVTLGQRSLICLDTPGHANHHICLVDPQTAGIFTGDMFGLSYRELDVAGKPFIFPTTTPTQFDPVAMRQSIERLLSYQPQAMYLTHYSQIQDVPAQAEALLRHLDRLVALAESTVTHGLTGEARHAWLKAAMHDYLFAEVRAHDCELSDADLESLWATDLELNTQGLTYWLESRQVQSARG